MLGTIIKRPADQLDYDINFARFLPEADTIESASVQADEGIEVVSVEVFNDAIKVWLAGGESGNTYKVTATVTTAEGRVKEECFKVRVKGC